MKRQGRSIKDRGASERHSHCHAATLPRCHASTAFPRLSTIMSSHAMLIQSAMELFTLNAIQEMFRDELPNVGSFVKVNFEQKEIKIADEYAKVIIGQKQPIQANFEPSYFVSVSPTSAFGGLFWKELSYIEILDESTEAH